MTNENINTYGPFSAPLPDLAGALAALAVAFSGPRSWHTRHRGSDFDFGTACALLDQRSYLSHALHSGDDPGSSVACGRLCARRKQ